MEQDLSRIFLGCSVRRMRQMVERMEVCVGRLSEEQVWARGSGNENAVGNLLLHLDGNVRQWILSGVGGAEDRRERDAEFNAEGGKGKQAMMERLKETVEAACATMERLDAAQLLETRRIQNYEVTVMEAVYHVVEHFGQHLGQIIFATKMMTQEELGFYRHLKGARHGEKTP